MKNFWRNMVINITVRVLSGLLISAVSAGYVTKGEVEMGLTIGLTILFNVAWSVANSLLARWHVDLSRLMEGASRTDVVAAASTVGFFTKIKEAATPGPNPAAIEAANLISQAV